MNKDFTNGDYLRVDLLIVPNNSIAAVVPQLVPPPCALACLLIFTGANSCSVITLP